MSGRINKRNKVRWGYEITGDDKQFWVVLGLMTNLVGLQQRPRWKYNFRCCTHSPFQIRRLILRVTDLTVHKATFCLLCPRGPKTPEVMLLFLRYRMLIASQFLLLLSWETSTGPLKDPEFLALISNESTRCLVREEHDTLLLGW